MKKFFILASAVILLSTGCSIPFFQKQATAPAEISQEAQVERKTGVVNTPDEIGLMSPAAQFMLFTEAGEQLFIESTGVNLKKYKKRRVEVEGKWNKEKTIFTVENITSIGNEMQVKTAYQNTDVGIKFQYPSVWVLKEEKNLMGSTKIIITPYDVTEEELANVDSIVIERSENNKKLKAREWLGLDDQYRLPADPLNTTKDTYQQSLIGVAQLDAVKKVSGTGDRVDFYVNRDTFIYRFSHITMNDSDKDVYKNAFYDLVMSFEFVPFGETVGTSTAPAVTPPVTQPKQPEKKVTEDDTLEKLAAQELAKRQQEEAAKAAQAASLTAKQTFINFIKANIAQLAPEAATLGGTWSVSRIEFAFPEGQPDNFNAAYVVYEDGHDLRKILLSISDRTAPEKMTRVAYFKPGTVTDWTLADGVDSARESEKSIVPVSGSVTTEVVVKKGMRLLEAKAFKIKIQYPANWYWASLGGGYGFSDKPVDSSTILMKLTKDAAELPPNMESIGDLGGRPAMSGEMAEAVSVCVQGKAKYCLSGQPTYQQTMKDMLATLQED